MQTQAYMRIRLMGPNDEDLPDGEHTEAIDEFLSLTNEAESRISDQLPEGWYVKIEDSPE